jgi:hypothetical protein
MGTCNTDLVQLVLTPLAVRDVHVPEQAPQVMRVCVRSVENHKLPRKQHIAQAKVYSRKIERISYGNKLKRYKEKKMVREKKNGKPQHSFLATDGVIFATPATECLAKQLFFSQAAWKIIEPPVWADAAEAEF